MSSIIDLSNKFLELVYEKETPATRAYYSVYHYGRYIGYIIRAPWPWSSQGDNWHFISQHGYLVNEIFRTKQEAIGYLQRCLKVSRETT